MNDPTPSKRPCHRNSAVITEDPQNYPDMTIVKDEICENDILPNTIECDQQGSLSATRKYFTDHDEELIIEFYRTNKFLWDPKDANYKNAAKNASLQELVERLGNKYTDAEIHHRFKCMRTTYRNNVAKIKKSTLTGDSHNIYVPTWPHFTSLTFLDDVPSTRPSRFSFTIQDLSCDQYEVHDSTSEAISSSSAITPPSLATYKKTARASMPPVKQTIRTTESDADEESVELSHSAKNLQSHNNDRCVYYGQYVAASLQAMSPWSQTLCISEINNVLIKYDPNNPKKH